MSLDHYFHCDQCLVNVIIQIVVLEEQKKVAARKAENELTTETGQSTARPTNVTHEMHGKLNMNETSEEETQVRQLNSEIFVLNGFEHLFGFKVGIVL